MAGDPSNILPWRWAPGQSGNPGGASVKRRQARRLRQALDVILADEAPAWLLGRLPPELAADCPPGVTFAELVALRLVWTAATAHHPQIILAAARMIVDAQAKPDTLEAREPKRPPTLPSTEERRQAVAEQLGVTLERDPAAPTTPETPGNVH